MSVVYSTPSLSDSDEEYYIDFVLEELNNFSSPTFYRNRFNPLE